MNHTLDHTKFKSGGIILCRSKRMLSKTIMETTGGDWSHVAKVIIIEGKVFVIDAQKEGVFARPLETWKRTFDYECELWNNPKAKIQAYETSNCMQYAGVPYDKKHLAVGLMLSWVNAKEISEDYENNGKFICTEFVMKTECVDDPHKYTPQDVANYVHDKNFKLDLKW